MKKIYLFLSMLTTLFLASCQDVEIVSEPNLKPNEYLFSISIPEPVAATRALGEAPAAEDIQNMTVLVFDENGLFLASRKATVTLSGSTTQGQLTVELPPSNDKRILHFVAGGVTFGDYSRNDSENEIFSNLNVSGGQDAYWQRIEVTQIKDATALKNEVGNIQLIRNFAKISVTKSDAVTNLNVIGFVVVNTTNAGSVAPYIGGTEGGFANFTISDTGTDVYTAFTQANKGFAGYTQGTIEEPSLDATDFTPNSKYVYERRQVGAANPAYILLKANYAGTECYYKLDVVRTDEETYVTSYLNLYRNFHYKVNITSVVGVGYTSMEQAMRAAASNNLSSSVEVSQVNRIEDGKGNSLEVSTMDVMLVSNTPYTVTYKYEENNTLSNGNVKVVPVSDGPAGYNTAAVQKIENDGNGNITITPASALPATLQTQEFIVSTPSGLARRVSVKVRQPYHFDRIECQEMVKKEINAPLAIGIRLPENMPVAVFPLTFSMEPQKKSIYPNTNLNSIPVEAGNHSFEYLATVSYNDYRKSRSFYFHFKTNMVESETSIKVQNPYFEDVPGNTVSFSNTTGDVFNFGIVKFGPKDGTLDDMTTLSEYAKVPFGSGQLMVLEFNLHTGHNEVVGIYPGDYLEFVESSTGSAVSHDSNGGWAYSSNDPNHNPQRLVFRTTSKYVGGLMELYSMNHTLQVFSYYNPPVTLNLKYGNRYPQQVPSGTEVKIYRDDTYANAAATLTMGDNGVLTMKSFAGNVDEDILYFECVVGYRTYRGSMSVQNIVNNGTGGSTLTLTSQ